jgi:hypothetical protein
MRKLNKKVAAVAAGAVVVATAGVAYAYWTTTGSGEGSADVAAAENGEITLEATWSADTLVPGGSESVTLFASNSDPETDLYVDEVSGVIGTSAASCDPEWFRFADVTGLADIIRAGASDVELSKTGTLHFDNADTDQDGCKGATVTLTLTSN